DPGPRSSIPTLVDALKRQGIKKIDYILLTHIHIDHAGGAGLLLKHYPDAQVICHPDGIRHMVNPARLWEGSRKTLGKIAEMYGEIAPIPEKNIGYRDHIEAGKIIIDAIKTPGHASHHLCYRAGDILFTGDAIGVTCPLKNGFYLRIATPPVFIYETYRDSLKKVASLGVSHICFAHYGSRHDAKNVFDTALSQVDNWLATVKKHCCLGNELSDEYIFGELLKNDQGMAYYHALPRDVQNREKYLALNSIRGMKDYLRKKEDKKQH
ncbi:MAG: MBL fold metallo-hydrolase, partial [Deltaproteobacteria bacterium]|nr:MBL fold metallo-hydrolase [Deltaproteobacteria bacterium]